MQVRRGKYGPSDRNLRFEHLESKHLLTTFVDFPQTFIPIQDGYLNNGIGVDDERLAVSTIPATQQSHLTFDVTGFAGQSIHSAWLRLQVASDAASANVAVYMGSNTLWTERYLSSGTAPTVESQLDRITGSLTAGQWIDFDVTDSIQGDGRMNFLLVSVGLNDAVTFSSREGVAPPELIVTTSAAALAGDADGDSDVDGADFLSWQRAIGTNNVRADFDRNGIVDHLDLGIWQTNYGTSVTPEAVGNVIDFGATADDATFDDTAIQAALNNHASVFLPAGEYLINQKLVIPAGRHLYGPSSGTAATIRVVHDTGTVGGNFALEVAGAGVAIHDLVIDKDFVDGSYGVGIYAERRDFLTVDGVEIRDLSVRYGIHLIESNVFEFSNLYVHNFMMNVGGSNAPDMIQDSPAGIRVTRSSNGSITNSRIHDIEVGPAGRASISELIPSYGPQGYQSDSITLSDSSDVDVEHNNLWNSGELIDLLVSDQIDVRNNTMQMAFAFAVKVIGSQDSVVQDNYIADGAIGLWMGDHSSGEQATGNLIDSNQFVNNGSQGVYGEAASSRLPFATSGIYVDNDADGNTISNNDIYNFYGYLPQYLRQGTGANTFAGNDNISNEFGPAGGSDAQIVGEWTAGLTHENELIERNRALMFFTYAEDADTDVAATAVTYGGQSLAKRGERIIDIGTTRKYISAWLLLQDPINRATTGNFNVTWTSTPDRVGYSSAFVSNVYQPAPIFNEDTSTQNGGNTIASGSRATNAGDLVLFGVTAGNSGIFTTNNGYTKALEIDIPGADGMGGFKSATGADESASTSHTNLGGGALYMGVLKRNPPMFNQPGFVNVTTLGVIPDDGINDAVNIQSILNNPAFDELYFPPGTYHVDRPIFVRSNKTLRGDETGVSRFETLVDTAVFRVDNNVFNVTLSHFRFERPQTQDSNNEIIRTDNASFLSFDSLRIDRSASRAPMINLMGGNSNSVTNSVVTDYQVVRSELSPEKPGLHDQVFGVGINFVNNTNVTLSNNEVIQNAPLAIDFGAAVIKGVHQSSAIQVIQSSGGTVSDNHVLMTGQGMDLGLSDHLSVSGNFIEEVHSAGIKLVNGANNNTIESNYIRNAGLTGIWVSAGNAGLGGSYENLVQNNTLVGIGKGFGLDFWDFNFALSTPAAIHIQAAQLESDRVRNNTIINNNSYDNAEQRGIVVAEPSNSGSPFEALINTASPKSNTASNNIEQPGLAPPPPVAALQAALEELFGDEFDV